MDSEMILPKDSGAMREFETGAHRDAAKGKGRCDLLPLRQVADVMQDQVLLCIAQFLEDQNPVHLQDALREASHMEIYQSLPNMMIEVSKIYEAGAEKYGENNWRATRS